MGGPSAKRPCSVELEATATTPRAAGIATSRDVERTAGATDAHATIAAHAPRGICSQAPSDASVRDAMAPAVAGLWQSGEEACS